MACVLALCGSSVARAVEWLDYEYTNEDGVKVVDVDAYNAAVAAERVAADGYANEYLIAHWWYTGEDGKQHFDNAGFEADYALFLAEKQKEVVPEPPPAPQDPPQENVESAGTTDGEQSPSDSGSDGRIPVGSYVDEAGNVFSPNGELLSPGTTPAPNLRPDDSVPGDVPLNSDVVTDVEVLTTIAGLVSDIADDTPTYVVSDLRPSNPPVVVPSGLKALVVSIFGEYEPIMTTELVSETVGETVYQYYVDTVAPGAAGIDYEWLAGVLLFAVLLFCLLKLLGGVLK